MIHNINTQQGRNNYVDAISKKNKLMPIKPLKFIEQTIQEFNFYQDTFLTKNMTFDEAMNEIEVKENNYFYTSLAEEDVQEAYENEYDIARQLELYPIYIKELGIYIALQP